MALAGQRILVTRPQQQAVELINKIEACGGKAIALPVIDIVYQNAEQLISVLEDGRWDKVIFISRNAVEGFCRQQLSKTFQQTQLVAVGTGTAQALQQSGLIASIYPKDNGGSEHLLALPKMQNVAGEHILIVRGKGGRELLAERLLERGANIEYAEVYRRVVATPDPALCQQALLADSVIATSQMGVECLLQIFNSDLNGLLSKPLVVLSDRIKEFALDKGFSRVAVTSATSDDAIIEKLVQMES